MCFRVTSVSKMREVHKKQSML